MGRRVHLLMYAGIAAIVYGLCVFHHVFRDPEWWTSPLGWPLAYVAYLSAAAYVAGLPDVHRARRQLTGAAVMCAVIGTLAMSLSQLVVGAKLLPRSVVFVSILLVIPWFVCCAALARRNRSREHTWDRVVYVGEPAAASEIGSELSDRPERPAVLVGSITTEDATAVNDSSTPLVDLARRANADVLVLSHDATTHEPILGQAASLHESGVRIRTVALFYEEWLAKLPVSHLERVALMFDIREVHSVSYLRVRRVMDLSFALVGMVALILVTPFVLLGNLIANPGPLLFRQARVGRQGKEFEILKFRSMRPSTSSAGEWTTRDDPRITPFGGFLRRTHLDELPQVVNILRGDLAVVGPRPEQPHYVEQLSEKLPFYTFRLVVTPGLTSWGQVKCGYSSTEEETLDRLQYEFFHLRHQTLAFDCRIIARTLRSVVGTQTPGR